MTHKPSSPDHHVRGVVHDYWIERRELRKKAKAQGRRRGEGGPARSQANKGLDRPVDLWDKVI